MITTTTSGRDLSGPSILEADQPGWLKKLRLEAWNTYNNFSLPGRKENLWKYSDPEKYLYNPNSGSSNGFENGRAKIPGKLQRELEAGNISGIVYNNEGRSFDFQLSNELKKAGVVVGEISALAKTNPDLVEPYLGKIIGEDFGKFEALNLAVWTKGLLVYIPKGVVIDKPLHLLTRAPSSGSFVFRTIVITEESSGLTLIDEHIGGDENSNLNYINAVTESFAGKASFLRHLMVQNLSKGAHYYLTHRSNAENDARTLMGIASFGAKSTKANFGTHLVGRGSESTLEGFLLGEKRQHFDHHTIHDHAASNTLSNLNFKVVLKDSSYSAYTGKIVINTNAPFSEAYQENRNLLLSEKCHVESIPELVIKQDEVRCSHGAAMGPPEQDQIFYLKSRGIPKNEAIQLIVEGFMEDALQRIPESLKDPLRNYINDRLQGGWTFE